MDGFFVTINCSKIFDSNETFYKIFIRKNEMSIVYELVEWIRFMFGLERCFFLIHENSVIHELEDISVLEILNSLEIRPCLRSNCIHKKMEKNLFHKLNLFTYWNEMKVHKLFQARCNYIIQKVSNTHHLNIREKPDCFPLQSGSNFFQVIDKSVLADDQEAFISPSKLTHKLEDDRCQVTETINEDIPNKYRWDLKKADPSLDNKNIKSNEINTPKEFSSENSESLTYPKSNNLNLLAENCALSSFENKKQKTESNSKKNKKIGLPFSLGALLSNIREEAQSQEFGKDEGMDLTKKSFDLACSVHENTENKILLEKKKDFNKDLLKKRRKRKHKNQNVQMETFSPSNYYSWDYYEPSVKAKPNHIRFNDNDEAMEIEATENESTSLHEGQVNLNSSETSNNVNRQTVTVQLTAKSNSSGEQIDSNENCQAEDEICEKIIDSNSEEPNNSSQADSSIERKKLDDSQANGPDLEALKQKIKHPKIYLGFY